MKLQELNEQQLFNTWDDVVEYIQTACSPYFNETEKPMYRGMSLKPSKLVYHQRDSRRPNDTGQDTHDTFNEILKERFGFPYRNGVFATGELRQARIYSHGDKEVAFAVPIGKFTYCWSQSFADLYDVFQAKDGHEAWDEITKQRLVMREAGKKMTLKDGLEIIFEYANFSTTDLNRALDARREIMMNCPNGFIALSLRSVAEFEGAPDNYDQIWKDIIE